MSSKGGSSKQRRRRRRLAGKSHLQDLMTKVQEDELLDERDLRFVTSNQEKMSEVILDFVEPYRHVFEERSGMEWLITFAVIAWNAALVSSKKRRAMLNDAVDGLPDADKEMVSDLLEHMLRRKKQRFRRNRRMIYEYNVAESEEGLHVSIASTM
jgi:hypothetical protein